MTDREGLLTFVNPQFERVYGYAAAEVVGQTTPRLLNGGTLPPEYYQAFWHRLLQGEVVQGRFVNRTKDGALLDIDATVNPIWDDAHQVVGFLAIQRDVSARTQMENALRRNEEQLRLIADNVSDMVSQVTLDGTYVYASPAHRQVLGYSPEALLGTSAFQLVHPEDLAHVQAVVGDAIRRRISRRFEFRSRHANGEYLWLEAAGTLLVDATNTPVGAVLSARDVTERKNLEAQFRQAQKMEAIGHLAGGVAHDFNNELTVVLGFSELLLARSDLATDVAADVGEIKNAGERAARVSRQLLAFSRRQILTPQVLDLSQVVNETQRMLRHIIGADILLEVVPTASVGPVKTDPGQIEQLLMNLAVNARDAMPKGGHLTLTTANAELDAAFAGHHAGATPGSYVALSVRDTGCGMTADVLAHAFEPFFTTKPVGKGTGLGLATVYGVVKQTGGCVVIESAPAIGTTVTCYFPRTHEPMAEFGSDVNAAARLGGRETILLVEDDIPVRELAVRVLEPLGYQILRARDGVEASTIEAHHAGAIDLLLSDLIMPGLGGPDLAQHLVRRRPALKVLFVSGMASVALRLGVISDRATFLQKPFTPDRLAARVREVLDLEMNRSQDPPVPQ